MSATLAEEKILSAHVPTTDSWISPAIIEEHVRRMIDVMQSGGVVIVPNDMGYGLCAFQPDAMQRTFQAKQRSFDKPCGVWGSWEVSGELHVLPAEKHEMVRQIDVEENLPFAVVADMQPGHPLVRNTPPATLARCSKNGTMEMIINGGAVHEEIVKQSLARGMPVFGSSANMSQKGTKYRVADIEPEVMAAVDLCIDHGTCKYASDKGLSSTIIDLRDFKVVRAGHFYEELRAAFKRRFDVELVRQL
jgi:tRNA A37 threonylcarbamoyladenosine synthetase subunit TsaC/SUA5/YrdC